MIVVFGHTGFIGSELCRQLKAVGYEVAGYSSYQCDLMDREAVCSRLGDLRHPFDIVNCAVINRNRCNDSNGLEKNSSMFRNIVEAIPAGCCRSFIQLSSVDVYGLEPTLPISEYSSVRPETYYARAKLDCERQLEARSADDFPAAVLRLPGVYGPGDQGNSLIGKLLRKTVAGEPICLSGGGAVLRDYLMIDDLTRFVLRLLEEPQHLLVNLVSGQSKSLQDILTMIFAQHGKRTEVRAAGEQTDAASDLVFDNSYFREKFPDYEFTPLAEGIKIYADKYTEI